MGHIRSVHPIRHGHCHTYTSCTLRACVRERACMATCCVVLLGQYHFVLFLSIHQHDLNYLRWKQTRRNLGLLTYLALFKPTGTYGRTKGPPPLSVCSLLCSLVPAYVHLFEFFFRSFFCGQNILMTFRRHFVWKVERCPRFSFFICQHSES